MRPSASRAAADLDNLTNSRENPKRIEDRNNMGIPKLKGFKVDVAGPTRKQDCKETALSSCADSSIAADTPIFCMPKTDDVKPGQLFPLNDGMILTCV